MSRAYDANLTNHNPGNYNTHADFVYSKKYTSAVLGLLDAQLGERIADLGCGTGELTLQIREAVGEGGAVVGVDSSQAMIDKAQVKGTPAGITFQVADIQDYTTLDPKLKGTFDAVFSSATFHWCKRNPGGVVETIKWLLKPGGRVAFEFGGFGNTVGIRSAVHQVLRSRSVDPIPLDPFYFPTVAQYAALLSSKGFDVGELALHPRPTPLTTDMVGWLNTFVRDTFLPNALFSPEQKDEIVREVAEISRADCYWNDNVPGSGVASDGGKEGWEVMYVRLRGVATAPSA